jgi:hypothetical protein
LPEVGFNNKFIKIEKQMVSFTGDAPTVGRMHMVQPSNPELFYLRLLLCYTPGATSHEYIKTFEGETYTTFKQTAMVRGLIEDDAEWKSCLQEVCFIILKNK